MSAPLKAHWFFRTDTPGLPAWTCGVDRQPWPCLARQAQLRERFEGNRDGLILFLEQYHEAATVDMPHTDPYVLREQMVGWVP